MNKAYFHLPGLFEFYDFYKVFLPLFYNHKEYFYEYAKIGSIYGNPSDCIWSGGRVENSNVSIENVINLLNEYNIEPRLTFSNLEVEEKDLNDALSNLVAKKFNTTKEKTGIIISSDILLNYLKENYNFYYISSTTKVLTRFSELRKEIENQNFKYVVPDFRLNKDFKNLDSLTQKEKDKVEFLVNEACPVSCKTRKECYKAVSAINKGLNTSFKCPNIKDKDGYKFSDAMKSSSFISNSDIKDIYLSKGFSNFKIEGRGLGSAYLLEFILYYMVRPEYQINLREDIYLTNSLDLF